jgi:hypothetical protein
VNQILGSSADSKEVREMKPRWLLLAVGVICLMVLAPAAALSQEGTEIACGSAVIDGTVGTAEWADATVLPMKGYYYEAEDLGGIPSALGAGLAGQVQPANGEDAEGWLYLKNDEGKLYVGATMDIGDENPAYWGTSLTVGFTDEPCGDPGAWVDDEWEASGCADSPHEGWFSAWEEQDGATHETGGPDFLSMSQNQGVCLQDDAQGVVAKAGQHTVHYEMSIDLEGSELDCVGSGDCFRFFVRQHEGYCPAGDPACPDTDWIEGVVEWPQYEVGGGVPPWPDVFGTICLNPCAVEFVPEPGTVLLLGSGLLSLAGYAGLRWRTRE